jgi:hypothetical protein
MELNLEPLATACVVSGQPFVEGDRVLSYLIRKPDQMMVRADILSANIANYGPPGAVVCRWAHIFKPRAQGENADRALKLTAETLFLTLVDPLTEPTPENQRMVQFLALMLERKKLLKPKGLTPDRERTIYEHAKTKQRFEISADDLNPAFFMQIQQQLGVLVGEPKAKTAASAVNPPPGVPAEASASSPAEPATPAAPDSPSPAAP